MKIKAIIFDCDGVILDSNLLKSELFKKVLQKYPKKTVDLFIEFQKKSFGLSRYKLFEIFFTEYHISQSPEEKIEKAISDFGNECKKTYFNCEFTTKAEEVLKYLYEKEVTLFVASGSDELELNSLFELRNIKKYFSKILGSPKTKSNNLKTIINDINKNKIKRENIVFIGDAYADLSASVENNVKFIFMEKYSLDKERVKMHLRPGIDQTIVDMANLQQLLT